MRRRNFIATVGSLASVATITRRSRASNTDTCSCVETRSVSEQTEPDFTVSVVGIDDPVPFYWKENDEFVDIGYSGSIGLAFGGDDKVWLNNQYTESINQIVVAHEIGHLLGYGHIDGTIMAPTFFGMDDSEDDVALTDVTRDVVSKIDGMEVMAWDDDVAMDHLQRIAIDYSLNKHDGMTPIVVASNRFSGYLDQYDSVYFSTHWRGYGSVKNGYYRLYSGMF